MYLTPMQMKHLPTIEWLISDDIEVRAVGKTTLILYAIILEAIKHPTRNINIIDHYPMTAAHFDLAIMPLLSTMIEDKEFEKWDIFINHHYRTLNARPRL